MIVIKVLSENTQLDLYNTIFSGFTLLITIATIIILTFEIRNQRKAIQADAYKAIIDILQDQIVRRARKHVLTKLKNKPFNKWNSKDIRNAEEVCQTYDAVGQLVENGFIPEKFVIDNWGHSILPCWKNTKALVCKFRCENNAPEIWNDFENLANNQYIKQKPYFNN